MSISEQRRWNHRYDMLLTAFMALAAIGTAWTGFQSASWSGAQSDAIARAAAAQTEASRLSLLSSQQRVKDSIGFTAWLTALNQEIAADPASRPDDYYVPDPKKVSGFLFLRFGPQLAPATQAWLLRRPLTSSDAPPTPLDMPEYQIAADSMFTELSDQVERETDAAQTANQRAINYVLTAVVLAQVLFFAGLGSKAKGAFMRGGLLTLTCCGLAASAIILAVSPVRY